jgi:small-conductance mechanosensitive channel
MATQQQFPMDPNTPLGQLWARNGGRKRQKDQSLSLQSSTMQREQLHAYAHMEARSWEVVESKERAVALETKWKEAKESIETRNRILREAAAAGHSLNQEAKTLTDNIALLRESMQEVKAGFRKAKQLPYVEAAGFRCVPRVFASVSSYFRAMNYEFNEQTFEQFFSAAQEI